MCKYFNTFKTQMILSKTCRDVTASGLYVLTYHYLLEGNTSPPQVFLAGGLAGRIENLRLPETFKSL
jgi:hypothetical protein